MQTSTAPKIHFFARVRTQAHSIRQFSQSSRTHKDGCHIIRPGCLSLFMDCLTMPLDCDQCVCARVCVFAQTHTATLGAMEALCNSWSAAGYRLPVTHHLADCGSSAHYSGGRV